jgi:selenocysteine-specific elongation factor
VGGIDAVLLVIAADEGVMPQTREHLDILKLLQIRHGLIILTKVDLVEDPEWLELVENDIRSLVQDTFLRDAPILRVSALTGEGLQELGNAIDAMLIQCPARRDRGKPRLPIDRVFSIKGFGTVVTGTLTDGKFTVGQQVEIQPGERSARIRGIQNHKKAVELALPGNRTAINLAVSMRMSCKEGRWL